MSSKLASLHAGLIARKGEAQPAMSRPALSYPDKPRPVLQTVRSDDEGPQRPGFGAQVAQVARAVEARIAEVSQDERLLRAFVDEPARDEPVRAVPEPVRPAPPPRQPAEKPETDAHLGPYRLTFRMTRDQRRRLRIAAAKKDVSLQALLSEALDTHLDSLCACALRECTCLAREGKD